MVVVLLLTTAAGHCCPSEHIPGRMHQALTIHVETTARDWIHLI